MFNLIKTVAAAKLAEIRGDDRGADAFEYLLVVGVVMVAVIVAVTAGFPGTIVTSAITSVTEAVDELFA